MNSKVNRTAIKRHKTRTIKIGNAKIGSKNPVVIQGMCNTKTTDVGKTVDQINQVGELGCEMMRIAIPDIEAAKAIPKIKKGIKMPLIGDIHFDYKLALESIFQGIDKIRVNPGNISERKHLYAIISEAKKANIPIRVGINSGSVEKEILDKYKHPTPEALVESALNNIKLFEDKGFNNIVVSLKSTDVFNTIESYKLFAEKSDYPLHVGVTEAGPLIPGIVKNTMGIATLLREGIGDTVRVSFTENPEVLIKVTKEILKMLGLYKKEPTIISCPTCGRTEIKLMKLVKEVEEKLKDLRRPLKVAVMGCVVNGPGEAKEADFGIAGGKGCGAIFKKGKVIKKVDEDKLVDELMEVIKNS